MRQWQKAIMPKPPGTNPSGVGDGRRPGLRYHRGMIHPTRRPRRIAALAVTVISGCSGIESSATPAPERGSPEGVAGLAEEHVPDADPLITVGRTATRRFFEGEDDALWEAFTSELREQLGGQQAALAAARLEVEVELGAEVEVLWEELVGQGDQTVYVRTSRFENFEQHFQVVFAIDADGALASFSIQPVQAEAPSDYLDYRTKTELQLPFEGEWTVLWGGRTLDVNYHTVYPDQRFAYDLLVMRDGVSHTGDGTSLEDYHCWGLRVLAPGRGSVHAAGDGHDDNVPGEMDREHALGNHVILDHGNGEYSFLSHLQKGSVAVEVGDEVDVGTFLGRCGNSGSATEPHIHYHLQDTPDFIQGRGMPAQFRDYVADGEFVERGEPVKPQVIRNQ